MINVVLSTALVLFMSFSLAFAGDAKSFQNQEFKVKGAYTIEDRADGTYITLNDEFKTKSAPDLKLFLSKNEFSGVNGKNATNNAVLVSQLKSHKGAQSYKIPAGINVSDYQSLLIHCEQYSKLWASTPIR